MSIREIDVSAVREAVARLCVKANTELDPALYEALRKASAAEVSPVGRSILCQLVENAGIARATGTPICQDTGLAVVFATVGQDVHFTGGSLEEAIHAGVAEGYTAGYLRKSVVADPLRRTNTGDNTPAIIHYRVVPGDGFEITVAPKGIGSENMSRLFMLKPSQGADGIREAVLTAVREAGASACPPLVIGVGVGGSFEKCAQLAKEALLRPIGQNSADPFWADFERDLLERVNRLGIGPQGLGGTTTALWLAVEPYATHIGGLPVAVCLNCHVARHESAVL